MHERLIAIALLWGPLACMRFSVFPLCLAYKTKKPRKWSEALDQRDD
jgi:hypothetical protein